MKKYKMLKSMELIDDKYIEEASPAKIKKKSKAWVKWGALAASVVLVATSATLWLTLPFGMDMQDVSKYSNSEYYSVIEKLNVVTASKPKYKNNLDKLISSIGFNKDEAGKEISDGILNEDIDYSVDEEFAPEAALPDGVGGEEPEVDKGEQNYNETTDNQVEGVIEADLIKRSDKYIYYLDGVQLKIYSIDKENSKEISSYKVADEYSYYRREFYLSKDCETVTVIIPYSNKSSPACIDIVSLDVSNPEKITEKNRVTVNGNYTSSRLVDGKLLLVNGFYVGKNPDFSDETTFLPQIDTGDGFESIPSDCIICPEKLSSSRYTIVTKFDEDTLNVDGVSAFLSYSDQVYVSLDSVYATRTYSDKTVSGNIVTTRSMTEISRLSYAGDEFEFKGSVMVEGYVKDQYSLDEYENMLRVVTTTDVSKYKENIYSNGNAISMDIEISSAGNTSANLYCIDLDSMKVAATVESFAPRGETVRSVRFDKYNAYVCTSVQLTDPVFFFDLSDINNITYKDTGTIEGFSSSLVNFGDGFLLGIGRGNSWDSVKIEVYEEGEKGVDSVCKYEIEGATYSTDYKSYLIDRENGFVGLGVNSYQNYEASSRYILLHFDKYNITEVINVPLSGDSSFKRAVYIDEYLYMFGSEDFKVKSIFEKEVEVGKFSYIEDSLHWTQDKVGVKVTGFNNVTENEIYSAEFAIALAKNEVGVSYDSVSVAFDEETQIWKVNFFTKYQIGADQTVYLKNNGITLICIYGE